MDLIKNEDLIRAASTPENKDSKDNLAADWDKITS